MALHYHCRHCGTKLGTLEDQRLSSEELGFHQLTDTDRQEMIEYDSSGDIHVKAICEDCHESLQRNPELYQNDYIIH
ncbi:anti-sigma-F factor Fin family protein [Bacillus massiliglaciei]|uniref:anti-sigma-F factor Fin family protein n=1 Tax=Bacillus massiliglaciei TaxID=1816693 RepID=UPI000DA60E4D|nr:anti-sigma-F factor Fin family protein [Bacillus massiliglaciei]